MTLYGMMNVKSIYEIKFFMIFLFNNIIFTSSGYLPQVFTIRNPKKHAIYTKTTRLRN